MVDRGGWTAAVLGLLVLAMGTTARAEDDAARGETIAVEACSSCHQVTARQVIPPPVANPDESTRVPAPSFFDIAAAHGDDADYLRRFILSPHYPMREQQWTEADLTAVIAYIKSLRTTPAQ